MDPSPQSLVRRYLKLCTLPVFHALEEKTLEECKATQFSKQWPKYRGLFREPGTRSLSSVEPIPASELAFIHATLYGSDDNTAGDPAEGDSSKLQLRLPAKEIVELDSADKQIFSNVLNEDDLLNIFKRYVLSTATEICRVIGKLPAHSHTTEGLLRFKLMSRLCASHHARWDIFALPSNGVDEVPLAIIFIQPWEFGKKDFEQLVASQRFDNAALDTLTTKEHIASDTVWAITHDALKGRGHKFIITNYTYWVYGMFNLNYTTAFVSGIQEPELSYFNVKRSPRKKGVSKNATNDDCTFMEMLVFWMTFPGKCE